MFYTPRSKHLFAKVSRANTEVRALLPMQRLSFANACIHGPVTIVKTKLITVQTETNALTEERAIAPVLGIVAGKNDNFGSKTEIAFAFLSRFDIFYYGMVFTNQ